MMPLTDRSTKSYRAISSDSFVEIDFNKKKKEAKKILQHRETLDYALEALEISQQLYQQIIKKLYLYQEGSFQYKSSIIKDLNFIQNNCLEKSKFPKIPNVGELEALEALIFPIKNLCSQLQVHLENEHTSEKKKELEKESRKHEALSKLLQEEQETFNKEVFFRNFLIRIKKEFGDKNPQPKGIYFVYAWPTEEKEKEEGWIQNFLKMLKEHLEIAGLTTARLDIVSNRYGGNIYEYMQKVEKDDYVLLFGTESLKKKHDRGVSTVCTEIIHILRKREEGKEKGGAKVFPILLNGTSRTAFPVEYERYVTIKDWREKGYLLGFQELYLELLDLAPERYLSKVSELWHEILAHLTEESNFKAQKKLRKYTNKRKKLILNMSIVFPTQKEKALANLPRKKNFFWLRWVLSLFIALAVVTFFCIMLFFAHPHQIFVKDIHPDFIGRQEYLNDLAKTLLKKKNHNLPVAVLWGEGGVGKSEIAIAFANAHLKDFSLIYWIESGCQGAYDQGYRDLAKILQIPFEEKESAQTIRSKVHSFLEQKKFSLPWLLIFDNAESILDLPQRGNGKIILTSRSRKNKNAFYCINVSLFNKEEAFSLFQKIVKTSLTDSRRKLIEELGYFPLLLNQAAHYIAETPGMTEQRYLELLQSNKVYVVNRMPLEPRYPYNFSAVWQITSDYLYANHKEALEWLYFCSYLYPDSIPQLWIEQWLNRYKSALDNDPGQREFRANDILRILTGFSLLRYDEKTKNISLHRLRQEILRNDKYFSVEIRQNVLAFLIENLKGLEKAEEMSTGEKAWDRLYRWEPHAMWFLNHFIKESKNDEIALLKNGLGNCKFITGNYKDAELFYKQALKLEGERDQENRLNIAICMNNLAWVLGKQAKYREAQVLCKKLLKLNEDVFGKESLELATSMHRLAWVLARQGKFNEAGNLIEHVLALNQKALGEENPQVASILLFMGWVLGQQGKYESAKKLIEKALFISRKFLREESLQVSSNMLFLGWILGKQGKYSEARILMEQSIETNKKLLGKQHPQVASYARFLGWVLSMEGKYYEARKLIEQSLEINKKCYGEEHPEVACCIHYLGWIFEKEGKYIEGKQCYEKALKINRYFLGLEHPEIAEIMHHLALLLIKQGRREEGKNLLEKALEMNKKLFGEKHPDAAMMLNDLGKVYVSLGNFQEAKKLLQLALKIYIETTEIHHPFVIEIQNNLSQLAHKER